MRNLAGVKECDVVIHGELEDAGFNAVLESEPVSGEVPTSYRGYLTVGRYTLRAERRWVYYSVDCTPALPLDEAKAPDETPVKIEGSHYSGHTNTLGDVVRAEGFAGGKRPNRPVRYWDVDTVEGLRMLVERVKELVGQ